MATSNPAQKLVVVVVGDTSQFEASLTKASARTQSFSSGLTKQAGGARAELLALAQQAGDSARASQKWTAERNRQLAESEAASTRAGAASVALAARYSLVGAAAYAGVQLIQDLTAALKVDGDQAGTVEGRFRNLGASLLRGDLIGGLRAVREEGHLSADALDALVQHSQAAGNQVEIDGLKAAAAAADISSWTKALNEASAAATEFASRQALDFSARGEQIISTPSGDVAIQRGTSPNDLGRMQGVGGTVGIPTFNPDDLNPPSSRRGVTQTQRNQWFDAGIARMIDQARDVPTLRGQIAALNQIEQLITDRIAVTKDITRKLTLEDQIRGIERQKRGVSDLIVAATAQAKADAEAAAQQRAALEKQRRENARAQLVAREFRMLGLSEDGSPVTPGRANLLKRIGTFEDNVAGTFLDTNKTRTQLARFRSVLAEGVVPKEIRGKIDEMLRELSSTLRGGLDKTASEVTRTTKLSQSPILAGLGLDRDTLRELRARLSHFNSAGVALAGAGAHTQPVNVYSSTTVVIDGRQIEPIMTKHQQKRRSRNPTQRRGPNAGRIGP